MNNKTDNNIRKNIKMDQNKDLLFMIKTNKSKEVHMIGQNKVLTLYIMTIINKIQNRSETSRDQTNNPRYIISFLNPLIPRNKFNRLIKNFKNLNKNIWLLQRNKSINL